MNHTQTKWEQRAERDGRTTTHYVKIGTGNCYLTRGVGQTENEVYSNARLIAAAPELLEALEYFKNCSYVRDIVQGDTELAIAVFKARAAIAKAKGLE